MIVGANNGVMRSNDDIFYKTCFDCGGGSGKVYALFAPIAELFERVTCPSCKGSFIQEDPFPECTCEEDEGNCPVYAWLDRQWKLQEIYARND